MTPTIMARTFPPTEPPQHRLPADTSQFPKTPPLSADWGPIRVSKEVELEGLDIPEFGMLAYPEDAIVTAES